MLRNYLIIVSGLPRSGTSLVMQMLSKGGIPVLQDSTRSPDKHNPNGYFEYQPINKLSKTLDISWLEKYTGYAVKIISPILAKLTIYFPTKIIFLNRPIPEIITSQEKMAMETGKTQTLSFSIDKHHLQLVFEKHIYQVKKILYQNPNLKVLEINFPEIFTNSENIINSIDTFLDGDLDKTCMRNIIKPELYRNKVEK